MTDQGSTVCIDVASFGKSGRRGRESERVVQNRRGEFEIVGAANRSLQRSDALAPSLTPVAFLATVPASHPTTVRLLQADVLTARAEAARADSSGRQ